MSGVLAPLGDALTQLPAGPDHPGRTVGPAFEMFYLMGNLVPWQDAAWALLSERVAVLAGQCATDGRAGQYPRRGRRGGEVRRRHPGPAGPPGARRAASPRTRPSLTGWCANPTYVGLAG